jgi:signal transduction histidine kinase
MKKICLGFLFILLLCVQVFAKNKVLVNDGVLDLSNWNWQKDGAVNLTGTWEFYWHKFYNPEFFYDSTYTKHYAFVPSFWNDYITQPTNQHKGFGYATYRLVVLCPSSKEQLALKFMTIESAYRLFVNGKEILNVGNADTSDNKTITDQRPTIINVTPENNKLDIVVQVSNFHNSQGGVWDVVKLGTTRQISTNQVTNISLELFVTGCLLISAIYYAILFIYFRKRYVLLFFSLICFSLCIRSFVKGDMPVLYIFNISGDFARRLEYISLYFSVPAMALLSYYLFPKDFSKKALYIIVPVCTVFIFLSLFTSYYVFTYPVKYFELIMLFAGFYGLYAYIHATINKRPGSLLFLAGFCILLATAINDILYSNLIIETVPLFYVGVLFFVITLSVLLSRQFSNNLSELHVANVKLSSANDELGVMNNEIKQKNEELKKINQELDSFVNRTSHDLRAPLHSVLGIIEAARQETNPESLQQYFFMQQKTLKRMNNLINDIIDFSKNKRLRIDLKEIDFTKLVENALEDHSFMLNSQKIHKNINIKQYEKFISDPRRISIIINNLVSNAIKYADPSKTQQEITINISTIDSMAIIEVADNGIGIEEQHLSKIFTLFYRATSSATGSGLGLYIIKETVEKLSGYVTINSEKGTGTVIKITIPDLGHTL